MQITHPLIKPLTLGEGEKALTVTELSIPDPADVEGWMVLEPIEQAANNNQSTILAVLAAITKQPYALIRKISMADLTPLKPALDDIMGNVPK